MANDQFEFDVALSFAEHDKGVADELASRLQTEKIRVVQDEYRAADFGDRDFVTHIAELFRTRAHCCVLLISQHYPLQKWTEEERTYVQQHALRDANEYILLMGLDDTEVAGIREATGYRDLREHSMESIVNLLEERLAERRDRSGPPSKSHDLRSGNVPSTDPKS